MYVKLSFFNVFCCTTTTCFFYCPCFYKAFRDRKILKNVVVYDQKPNFEVICIGLKCKAELYQKVHIPGPRLSDQMFNAMKKLLIQHFFRIDGQCKIVPE